MKGKLKIALKPGEKIYVNGAVISVDRKVSLEFLNDVQFLMQNHVLQAEDATTPLKQLYFIVQIMLMTPDAAAQARDLFRQTLPSLIDTFASPEVRSQLKDIDRMVGQNQVYEALRTIRSLFGTEAAILDGAGAALRQHVAHVAAPVKKVAA